MHREDTLGGWGDKGKAAYFFEQADIVIPKRREQIALLAELLPWPTDEALAVLDLGAGFGAVTEEILGRYPHATVTCVDGSAEMMALGRARLGKYGERVRLRHGDLAEAGWRADIGAGFHAAVSALAIHHVSDERKRALCREVFAMLVPGGIFLNNDPVTIPAALKDRFEALLYRQIQEQERTLRGRARPIEEIRTEMNAGLRSDGHHSPIAPLAAQLEWLAEAGFESVDCYWRFLNLAIVGGVKPSAA
ncbi:MAG: class I SAM-dependent methyltransferase [Candidatus Binataceae bacterium]